MASNTLDLDSKNAVIYAGHQILAMIYKQKTIEANQYVLKHNDLWQMEIPQLEKKFPSLETLPEVFHFHHGLRYAPKEVKDYIRKGDIFDIGAYIGDSAIVLSQYTDKKVYLYELSPVLCKNITENIEKFDNVFQDKGYRLRDKTVLINKGVSRTDGTRFVNDVHNPGGSINQKGNVSIEITYVDKDVKENNINLKYMKADVEGVGLEVLEGAKETIKSLRPVISIAIYHHFEEFFGVCEFMKQFPNYIWEFHLENMNPISFREISAFFYPAEIRYSIFPQENETTMEI